MKSRLIFLFYFVLCLSCESTNEDVVVEDFLFKQVPSIKSGVGFSNNITEDPEHSIINYIYYYNGGGVAAGDVNNDGLPDLFFVSNMGENKLYLNKGNLSFKDISEKSGIESKSSWNTGVSMVDVNNDGWLDIYVCSVSGLLDFTGHNELFINNQDGTFTEKSSEYGLDFKGYATQAYFFDFDKDLDLDVYIVNHAVHTTLSHGNANVRSQRVPFTGDVLLQNNKGKFMDVSEKANIYGGVNGYGLSASLADFNNDGWDDIYVSNDFHEDDYYYLNNQDGTFTENVDSAFSTISRFSMGSDAGDINGDGLQDLITLDMLPGDERVIKESEGDDAMLNMQKKLKDLGYKAQYARNMLQINNAGNYFIETANFNNIEATDWSWAPLIADFNNDSFQDLFVSNGILRRPNSLDFKKYISSAFQNRSEKEGMEWLYRSRNKMPTGEVSNEIFMGNARKFENKTGNWISEKAGFSNGAIYTDLDLDGDLDLVINNLNSEASIYENTLKELNYFVVDPHFIEGNKEGLGTKVIVYSGEKAQLKQLFISRGFLSSVESKLFFGIPKNESIDSVAIIWPNSKIQKIYKPQHNKLLSVTYEQGLPEYEYSVKNTAIFKRADLLTFSHQEDSYNDFFNEKLIPYKVSTMGPAVAIADIDQNGYKDLFVGNSSGKAAKIFMNSGTTFSEKEFSEISGDSIFEDNSAVFFDADGDGDQDLYVGSGINTARDREYEKDRLYLYENGNFIKTEGNIADNYLITSTTIAADYDMDGDMDLFIGNEAEAGNFGKAVNSYLLKNDGKGHFNKDENFQLSGHVASAKWSDIDGDQYPELLVASEWESPYIFKNNQGSFQPMEIPKNLNGLWQAIEVFDVDQDGDKDILLGNWGYNTRFKKGRKLRMYHSDFNEDGIEETVLAYQIDGKYYPLASKDELASQINYINKVFPTHEAYALKTINQISTEKAIRSSKIYEIDQLASGYLENNNNSFGQFKALPDDFQMGPITTFSIIEENEPVLIIGGNSFKVNTYHGGYSSLKGLYLRNLEDYGWLPDLGTRPFDHQIKDLRIIKMKDEKVLVVIPNNAKIETYKFENL